MATIAFNTLKFAKRLETAGVSAPQAEARRKPSPGDEAGTGDESDLALLEARLSARIDGMDAKLGAMDAKLGGLETRLVLKLGSLTAAISSRSRRLTDFPARR